jgi:hypothetical protein
VAEWQRMMSSHEFAEWMAYFQLQPFGEWRRDFRNASLMALIANVMTRSKDSDPVKPTEDFMPDFEKALDEKNTQEEIPEHARLWQKIKSKLSGLVKPKTNGNNPPAA